MTKSTDSTKKDIGTIAREVGYRTPAGLFTPARQKSWKVLDSRELLRSLHNIKDKTVEPHTKNNIQALIDQIYGMEFDV